MATMNISLPDALRELVDEQVTREGYATSSEHLCELIRHDQGRLQLRAMLLQGAQSPRAGAPIQTTLKRCASAPARGPLPNGARDAPEATDTAPARRYRCSRHH